MLPTPPEVNQIELNVLEYDAEACQGVSQSPPDCSELMLEPMNKLDDSCSSQRHLEDPQFPLLIKTKSWIE